VESELERRLATSILRDGAKLVRRRVARGETLVEQGEPGRDLFVLLDGVFDVEIDGEVVAQVGSGAILGEKQALETGVARQPCARFARRGSPVISSDAISRPDLAEISASHAGPAPERS
jgi:CRP-like cAMP-binding protein